MAPNVSVLRIFLSISSSACLRCDAPQGGDILLVSIQVISSRVSFCSGIEWPCASREAAPLRSHGGRSWLVYTHHDNAIHLTVIVWRQACDPRLANKHELKSTRWLLRKGFTPKKTHTGTLVPLELIIFMGCLELQQSSYKWKGILPKRTVKISKKAGEKNQKNPSYPVLEGLS